MAGVPAGETASVPSTLEDRVSEQPDFAVEVTSAGRSTTVRIRGELDVASAPELRRALDRLVPTEVVTLDVSEVGFIDSTGLGCIFRLQHRVADAGGMLVVAGASRSVRRVMETTGLHRVVAILPAEG
jgi:anti-anti-sigma factor